MRAGLLISFLCASGLAEAAPPSTELLSLRLTHEAPLERGRGATLSLGLVPQAGLRLLDEGPLVIELVGSAIEPARRVLRRQDAVDPRAESPRFELEVRAQKTGTPSLSAHVTAWVCRGATCRPVELTTTLPLELAEHAHGRTP